MDMCRVYPSISWVGLGWVRFYAKNRRNKRVWSIVSGQWLTRTSRMFFVGLRRNMIDRKWSTIFDERPHRRVVASRGGEWSPILTSSNTLSFGPHESALKRYLGWFSRFCRAHERNQQTQTDKHTNRPRYSVCSNSPHLMQCMRCGLISLMM